MNSFKRFILNRDLERPSWITLIISCIFAIAYFIFDIKSILFMVLWGTILEIGVILRVFENKKSFLKKNKNILLILLSEPNWTFLNMCFVYILIFGRDVNNYVAWFIIMLILSCFIAKFAENKLKK